MINIRDALKAQFFRQCPQPAFADLQQLGRAIEWRIVLLRSLPINRSAETPFPLIIQRQIENELDLYQRQLYALSDDLQTGEIYDDEFQRRLRNLTIAILILAFLRGSQVKDVGLTNLALAVLRGGGQEEIELDYSRVPPEAVEELQDEIDVSVTAGAGLATAILDGRYEDRGAALSSRLALWATTALGVYTLGQLFRPDGEARMQWLWGATIEHCRDCRALNGQVHTVSEWLAFFQATKKRPAARALACGGWQCLCGIHETSEPVRGELPLNGSEKASYEQALGQILGKGFTEQDVIEEAV